MGPRTRYFLLLMTLLWVVPATHAVAIEDSIVYLQCTHQGSTDPVSGTGVVVTDKGDVLTAKHVAMPGSICRGSISIADPQDTRRMTLKPFNTHVDAAILQFTDQRETYHPVEFCNLEDWMIRRRIFVAGFPGTTQTGAASFREGILSTVFPNAEGTLETDGQTVAGMSGGPVLTNTLDGLLGLVIGARFDPSGEVDHWGILPIAQFVGFLGLEATDKPCYRRSQTKNFTRADGTWGATWSTGKLPVALDMSVDEGVCFMTGVSGELDAPNDFVRIEIVSGRYVLNGNSQSEGHYSGTAGCFYYE